MRLLTRELFGDAKSQHSKTKLFLIILAVLGILWLVFSLVTRFTFISDRQEDFRMLAVAGPMSGDHAEIGRSMRQGAQLYLDMVNESGGLVGRKFALRVEDDAGTGDSARTAAEALANDDRIRGVVGHWTSAASQAAGEVYARTGLPAVTPASAAPSVTAGNDWYFSALPNDAHQARFLANYVRNVIGQKLVTVVVDRRAFGASIADNFEATFRRFGTAIRYIRTVDPAAGDLDGQFDRIARELAEKKDAGLLFLALDGRQGADFLHRLRELKVDNPVAGPDSLATRAFLERLRTLAEAGNRTAAEYTNGMMVSAPLLFDTANEQAQNFRTRYQQAYGTEPDWVAAYAFDAARLLVEAQQDLTEEQREGGIASIRQLIRDALAARDRDKRALDGVTGSTWFDTDGEARKPVNIGTYNGENIISALTQLQPIRPGRKANYIDLLKRGRVLYVNDRFMYKTNVVYTGLQLKEISELDPAAGTYSLDFLIWFRFRGDVDPQKVKFHNAVEPITLDEPLEEKQVGDMTYRLYRVKAPFNLDFTDTNRSYGSHVAGVSFSHQQLNRNNLLYVVDVLGMGLQGTTGLLDHLQQGRALGGNKDWGMDKAWISQDVAMRGTEGDPAYVGFGATDPAFSRIDLGVLLEPAEINARDFIPREYFIYIGIFGVLGSIFALLMDRKEKGRFWSVQSWGLRVVAWPTTWLALGNMTLDFAFQHLEVQYIALMVMGYDILWWLIPARLLGLAMERFIWRPLEDHTERNIPNVIRVFGSVVIYSFAIFGIIAFVFDQQLTSLLASTGLLAMIIGLAIQANISNIFSGIVINIERPFSVGDWVQIGDMDEGRVVDITWRTTRVKTRNGYVISMPNGRVSEAQVHNFDSFDCIRIELPIWLDPEIPPEKADPIMLEGIQSVDQVLDEPEYEVRFKGIRWEVGWVAEYELQFWIREYGPREEIAEAVLSAVYKRLRDAGLSPMSVSPKRKDEIDMHAPAEAAAS